MPTLREIADHKQQVIEAANQSVADMSKDQLVTEIMDLMDYVFSETDNPDEEATETTPDPDDTVTGVMTKMGNIDPNAALLADGQYAGFF